MKRHSSKQKSAKSPVRAPTDWERVDGLTDQEIERSVCDDPDAPALADENWFAGATLVIPKPKEQISIRLDRDVVEHFRRDPSYEARINDILRGAMEREKKSS